MGTRILRSDLLSLAEVMEIYLDFTRSTLPDATHRSLAQAERLLGCFQKALGHELPNRLVAIQGLARLLEEGVEDRLEPADPSLAGRIAEQAQRADRLVRTLAEIGRLSGTTAGGPEVSLADVVREAVGVVGALSAGGPVEYDLQEGMPVVAVSRRALLEVLVQLLRNAVQAALPGRPAHVAVGGRRTPAGTEFWVADQGRGLTPLQGSSLFDPFSRAGSGEGAGLGLFLVRQVVAAWGGTLRVRSEPGQGTAITVLLPLSKG